MLGYTFVANLELHIPAALGDHGQLFGGCACRCQRCGDRLHDQNPMKRKGERNLSWVIWRS